MLVDASLREAAGSERPSSSLALAHSAAQPSRKERGSIGVSKSTPHVLCADFRALAAVFGVVTWHFTAQHEYKVGDSFAQRAELRVLMRQRQ